MVLISLLFCCPPLLKAQSSVDGEVANPRTEYKADPIGIDVAQPRLSWEILSSERDVWQSAYQIWAADTVEKLKTGDNLLWDSGEILSDQSNQIIYEGPALNSGNRVYWQVRIWDNQNHLSPWSETAYWEMGLLDTSDWQASWIEPNIIEDITQSQPCPLLRKEFHITGELKSARAYVTCHGLYEMWLNGRRVGDQVFTPGWTSYNKGLQYQTYDVTELFEKGENAIGVILGDGWYRGFFGWSDKRNNYGDKLALLLQIKIEYKDGDVEAIGTDATWKATTGPILKSDIYHGETYDARQEMPGWNEAGFNDDDWKDVKVTEHSKEILFAQIGPPIRKIQEVKPVEIFQTPQEETVFDFGQNMVGWVRLKVKGEAGTAVTLRHAEVLDSAGNFYKENLRAAKQTTQYILKGSGEESFEPHFTFQGFRYVAVEGYPGDPNLDDLTGIVIHSDMKVTGSFECSNAMINQLQQNIQWGQKGNFLDVPTDCPQRDERMGWTGDAQVFARTACFNMDAASFYTKWLKDLAADQNENGVIPHVVPDVLTNGGSAAWADAGVIVPWTVYLCYGDKRILAMQYESMKAWIDYMQKQAGEEFLWNTGFHYGDWLAFNTTRSDYPGATTDKDLIATAYFAYSTSLLQKIAQILGKENDAEKFMLLRENIKTAFQKEFVTPNGRLASNTQTAYSLALAYDLLPDILIENAARRLADDVREFRHITTGFVGTPLICQVLCDYGYTGLAYMLLNRRRYPSWLYPITKGATTIWERWDGIKPDDTFQDPGMNSFNHYAYGAIGAWLYQVVAGIDIDESNPGYKHTLLRPHPGGGLTYARASHHSMYGKIESSWEIVEENFQLMVETPPNTYATAVLPYAKLDEVRESGKFLENAPGIKQFYQESDSVIVKLGSGRYQFEYPWVK
ncbi:MAG: alpha-L-rhamnosidase [Phycisphaerae bacterium SM23_30]|nr:MAG: alpha-L-rhamnosidase [Phycisphaerae bacterium SM23_30]